MFLHHTRATRRFLSTLTEFDPELTLEDPRNPKFYLSIRIGWGQHHCKYYQIPFPITTHGSKLELKWLRYPENRARNVILLPKVITFYPTVGFQSFIVFQKLDIKTFPVTTRSTQSDLGKAFIKPFQVSGYQH